MFTDPPGRAAASADDTPVRWDTPTRLSLASLTLSVFALVFSEFLPAGILTPMAADLGTSEGAAGQTVSATAIGGTAAALFTTAVIGGADRRRVLLALASLAVIGNLVPAIATGMTELVAARVALGIAVGGFWALSAGVVGRLVAMDDIGRATGLIMVGVATIAAPPAGALVADLFGWRAAFGLACALSVLALIVQAFTLPRLPASHTTGLATLTRLIRRPFVAVGLLTLTVIAGGHFAGFTFVRAVLEDMAGMPPATVAATLLAYGISNFGGNLVAAAVVDRHLFRLISGTALVIGVSTLGIVAVGVAPWTILALVCLWGFGFGAVPIALLTWTARGAPDSLEGAGSLFTATFQIAVALGAAAGGLIVDHAGVAAALVMTGLSGLLAVAAPALATALSRNGVVAHGSGGAG